MAIPEIYIWFQLITSHLNLSNEINPNQTIIHDNGIAVM